jgi:hypothetical protein
LERGKIQLNVNDKKKERKKNGRPQDFVVDKAIETKEKN